MTLHTNTYHQTVPPSQNRYVWLCVLLAISLVGIFFGTRMYVDYNRRISSAEDRLLTQTRVIDENISTNLTVVNLMLNDIATKLKDTSGNSQLNSYLKQQLVMTPGIRTLIVTNSQGRCIYSNRDELLGKDFPKDRDYFKVPRDAPDKGMLFISPPYTTILGKYVINITKPLRGEHHEFNGIVSASFDPEYFSELLSSTIYRPDNRVSLIHSDGTVFIAVPEAKIPVTGVKATQPGSALLQHIAGGTPTSVRVAAGKTLKDKQIFAYRTNIPKGIRFDRQIIVAASRNQHEVLAVWRMDTGIELVVFLLFASLSVVITRAMLQRGNKLKRLEESRAHLAAIVEFSDDAIISNDMNEIILSWNTGAERLFGYSKEDVVGKPISLLIPLELQDEEHWILQRLKTGELVEHLETVRIAKDGRHIDVLITSSPLKNSIGQVVGASKIIRDITERTLVEKELQENRWQLEVTHSRLQIAHEELEVQNKELQAQGEELVFLLERSRRDEEVLRESEEQLRKIATELQHSEGRMQLFIDHAPAALAMFDRNMCYLHVSRRWCNDYGLADRNLLGVSHYEIFPEISEQWKEAHRRGLAGEVLQAEADRFERADGSTQWIRWEIHPWYEDDNRVGGILIFTEEITARKLIEKELQESRGQLQVANKELELKSEELKNQNQQLNELWERSKQSENTLMLKNSELETAKKIAEDKRRWLVAVMETLPIGIAITDALGGTIQSNRAFEQVWGEQRPDTQCVENYAAYKAWWADTGKRVEPEEWASALATRTGEPVIGQLMRIQRFDDSMAFVINSAAPVFGDTGILIGCAVAIQDISEFKLVEESLRASEERIQQALHVSRSFTFDWLPVTDQVIRSTSCAAILDLTGDEAVNDTGKHYFQCVHPDDRASFVQTLRDLTPSANSYIMDYRYVCKDGSEITLEETGQASFDDAGRMLRLVGVSTDITVRKQAEEALRKIQIELELRVEERTSDLAEAIKILEEEILERQKAELNLQQLNRLYVVLSETNQTIVKISDRDSLFRKICQIAVDHGGFVLSWIGLVDEQSGKVNIVASSGATAYLNDIRISTKNEPGGEGPTGIAIREGTYYICNDFQNDPCTRPWQNQGKMHGIFASASIAIKENERVIGALTLYGGEKDYFDAQKVELLLQMGMDISFALDNFNRENNRKEAEKALYEETTERLKAVEILRDKEQMLIQQSRQAAMGEMIGNIAHQWRQPLNTLGLYTQKLGVFYGTPGFNKEFLDNSIAKSMSIIKHMSKTIDDFRDFFNPEKEKTDFYVIEAIQNSLSLLEGQFHNPKITIDIVEHDNPVINGYQNEFSQVFLNILNNARDAIIEREIADAKVVITICSEDDCAVVTVADNAWGIPDEIINKVFDPYFTTKGPLIGTGIGLFMSKTIIEKNMGGKLTVRNTDAGAEFRIEVKNGIQN